MIKGNTLNILLVEDEVISSLLIQRQLKNIGFVTLTHVTTGENAIESVRINKPDIILMDIKLAGKIDGIDTALLIQSEYNIPFIFITSYNDDDITERVNELKPLCYLEKPLVIDKLKEIIDKYIIAKK